MFGAMIIEHIKGFQINELGGGWIVGIAAFQKLITVYPLGVVQKRKLP